VTIAWLFVVVLAGAVGLLSWGFVRGWRAHRRLPGSWPNRARAIWSATGLRWSAGAYGTLHAAAGLIASILALAIFAWLGDLVSNQAAITRVDVQFGQWLHSLATPIGISIAKAFSFIGGPAAMVVLMVAGAVYLLFRRERHLAYVWLIAFVGGGALDWALKTLFHRARPSFPDAFVHVLGYSFPSGHAMGSLIGFGMLAYVVVRMLRRPSVDRSIAINAAVVVLGIGFSRLYLGAHYLSDVVAGFAAGIVWLAACISAAEAMVDAPS
jgi:undecaprenyl-diphosphatase